MRPARPGVDPSPGLCVNPRNPHSPRPPLRALFVALEESVTKGTARPPSRVPRIADGTAVVAENVRMPTVPGFAVAPGANQIVPPVDWTDPPVRIDNICGARVCAVERDGNEIPGIRLPPIAVPLSTYTGWNVYRAHSPVSSPTARARLSLLPGPRRSARQLVTRAPRPKSATAPARLMSPKYELRSKRWSASACH
jgi:Alpha/beta hydrolase domain